MNGAASGRDVVVTHGHDLEAIVTRVERVFAEGRGATILVEGEAGIGKTTVLAAAMTAAVAAGVAVVHASASVLDRTRPFGPLLDAFGLDPATRSRVLPASAAAAFRDEFEQELTTFTDGRRQSARVSPLRLVPAERAHTIERIAAMVETWSLDHPVLLALDDLHWADSATLATLGRLHRLVASQRLTLIAAFRPIPHNADLRDLVAGCVGKGAELFALGPLAPDAVRGLVADTIGHQPGPTLLDSAARAGGNPFLIIELVRSFDHDGRISIVDDIAELETPALTGAGVVSDVREVILRRMADLGQETSHLLQVASALGRTFSVIDVAAMLGRGVAALLPAISTTVSAGLLEEDGQQLRFRHDLVREAVESTIGRPTLAALHLDIARTLAGMGAPAVRVAAHYSLGAQPGDRTAVEWLRTAAAEIVSRGPTAAAELLERALTLTPVGDPDRDAVIAELVDAAFWGGAIERAVELARGALARPLPPALSAGLHETMTRALVVLGRPTEAVVHAERLIDLGALPAWAAANVAMFKLFALDLDGAVADARRAIELCEIEDDPWAETLAYCVAAWEENSRGFHRHAVELADRAVLAADRSPNAEAHRLIPHLFRGLTLESTGRTAEAQATLLHGQQLAEQLGTSWATPFYHYALALTPWNAGRWDGVHAEIGAGLRYAREHNIGLVASWACALDATASLFHGDLDAAEAMLDEGDERLATGGIQYGIDWLLRGRALLLEATGDSAGALAILELGWDVAEGLKASAALVILGPDLVRIALDVGDDEAARRATDALSRGTTTIGVVDDGRLNIDADALRCRGMLDRDIPMLFDARRIHTGCERPVEVAQDDEAITLTLARLRRLDEASQHMQVCVAACDELGITLIPERLQRNLAAIGPATADLAGMGLGTAKSRTARAATGWGALTATEHLVATLVAAGRTNPQVAAELLISRRTVESHLYRIFFKLGVSNRTELAVVAMRSAVEI